MNYEIKYTVARYDGPLDISKTMAVGHVIIEEQESWCCSECGSTDIEMKHWVNINTNKVGDTCSDSEVEDNYCNNCQEHTKLILKSDYEKL